MHVSIGSFSEKSCQISIPSFLNFPYLQQVIDHRDVEQFQSFFIYRRFAFCSLLFWLVSHLFEEDIRQLKRRIKIEFPPINFSPFLDLFRIFQTILQALYFPVQSLVLFLAIGSVNSDSCLLYICQSQSAVMK